LRWRATYQTFKINIVQKFYHCVFARLPAAEYDKHPNEVVKNEELTYNGAGATAANISAKALAVLYLVGFVAYERIIRR
jgi:hypothetical protein